MISIAIVSGIVLIVDREMLESSFQGFGSHGDDGVPVLKGDCFSAKNTGVAMLEEIVVVNLQVYN